MTPWQVIEEALVHRKPKRNVQWLADQLGLSIQVVSNWKARGVPHKRYREIAEALGLTVDQLEGIAPLPWAGQFEWPFSARLYERVEKVEPDLLQQLEELIWKHLTDPQAPTRLHLAVRPTTPPEGPHPPEVGDDSKNESDLRKRKRRGKGEDKPQ